MGSRYITIILFLFQLAASAQIDKRFANPSATDTLKSFLTRKNKPLVHELKFNLKNQKFSKKLLKGNNAAIYFNISCGFVLFAMPDDFSKWNKAEKLKFDNIVDQYQSTFTKPLVIDYDHWYINYIGHPYQGGFYYNNVRSVGATALQSSLYAIGQTIIWEYVWEGGMEQPSIQDFITTPFIGIVIGELTHVATIKMSRNGYTGFEKVVISILNPSFLINGNFKLNK
jgi:hypothetical protein